MVFESLEDLANRVDDPALDVTAKDILVLARKRSVLLLAAMVGGLVGVVFTADGPVQFQGFNLSLAALAFFIGFAIEIVFTVIEAMVEGVAGSFWFGFKDDVAVRIRATATGGSTVDVRSTSRVGLSDIGANAARIQAFLTGLKTRLAT